MVPFDWNGLAKLDAVPSFYFDAGSLVGFLQKQELLYSDTLHPIPSTVEREVAEHYGAREQNVGTV